MTTILSQQLSELVGLDAVTPTEGYAVDGVSPQAVVRPDDRQGVASVLQWASVHGVPVYPIGGRVMTELGNVPARAGVALDLSLLNRVLDYQPADLTVTVEAGITLESLRHELAQGDKFVPLEAPLAHRATVGGILATNFSGPLRYAYGLPRDWLIGISVVSSSGVETKAGGRVVKNVTGYDLNKLYTGSLGTLGAIVEASFKLSPLPDSWATVVAALPSMSAALEAARTLVSQVYAPQGLQVVSRAAARRLGLDIPSGGEAMALAFMAGRPRATVRRVEDSIKLLREAGALAMDTLDGPASQSLLRQLTDFGWDDTSSPSLGVKVNLPPRSVANFLAEVVPPLDWGVIVDPGFGTVHLLRWTGDLDLPAIMADIDIMRTTAGHLGGTAVVEHCPLPHKEAIDVWEGSAGEAELEIMRRIKGNFDPSGILNPGRFVGKL